MTNHIIYMESQFICTIVLVVLEQLHTWLCQMFAWRHTHNSELIMTSITLGYRKCTLHQSREYACYGG